MTLDFRVDLTFNSGKCFWKTSGRVVDYRDIRIQGIPLLSVVKGDSEQDGGQCDHTLQQQKMKILTSSNQPRELAVLKGLQ